MDSLPHGITNNFRNNELNFSYAHAVLQSLCFLDTTKELFSFMENNNMRNNNFFPMANEFLNLIEKINNGITPDSQNILIYFGKKYFENQNNIESKNVLSPDPFHFLYFFLQFLHLETNMSNPYDNSLFNQPLQIMKVDNTIYKEFLTYIMKTQNSIISNGFLNTIRYKYKCRNCGEYFYYGLQSVFRMNLDSIRYFRDDYYPLRKGTNLSLDELFTAYSGIKGSICRNCGNNNCFRFTRICYPAKTIIISLERKNHTFQNDINIFFKNDFDEHISKTRRKDNNINTIYELKAVISYVKFGNDGKYFADCMINKGNLKNIWLRYIDSYCYIIQPNDIFNYEPQILIYEVSNSVNNQQISVNNINLNNNNNINNQFFNNNINNNQNQNNNINNQIYNNINNNQNFNNNNNPNFTNNINNQIFNNILPLNNFLGDQMNIGGLSLGNMNDNNYQIFNQNIFKNTNNFRNSIRVEPSFFQNMQLVQSQNNINNNSNYAHNLLNIQQQFNNNNNPFMQQINQFNNGVVPNMQINLNNNIFSNEISIKDAQEQNKNIMKYFEFDYANLSNIIGKMEI